jgi:predicted anti-sigma-YlaC factor YlaD
VGRETFGGAREPKHELYREALSARLDGEDGPVGRAELDAHLAECPACRQWLDDAATVNRLARTAPAMPAIDVTEAVLPAAPGRWRGRLAMVLRLGLGLIGAAQLVLGVVQISTLEGAEADSTHGGATPGHLWHESAAWNVAVGAAFLWIAARRGRPLGVIPILTVFIGVLVVLSGADVLAGRVDPLRLASHGFVLVGYLIVLALSRPALDLTPPGSRQRPWSTPEPVTPPDSVIPFPQRDQRRRTEPAAQFRHREAA